MYTTLLNEEGIQSQFLIVLKPVVKETGFTLHASGVYKKTFSLGHVYTVEIDGVALTEGSSSTLSNNSWFFDSITSTIYIKLTGSDINSNYVVVGFEIHAGTTDAHWHRIPTETTSRVVYFDPIVIKSPSIKHTVSNSLFGFMTIQSSSITINNAEHGFEKFLDRCSFNKRDIDVYHVVNKFDSQSFTIDTANIKKAFSGIMGNVDYSGAKISIRVYDRISKFDREYRRASGNFFGSTSFPLLDPNYEGKPIRSIYGYAQVKAINVDLNTTAPTTSTNRIYAVRAEGANLNAKSTTVIASPSSTTTRTYLSSVTGFMAGDSVHFNKSTQEYKTITSVGINFIEHAALAVACTTSDIVLRGTISAVTIDYSGVQYSAMYVRDYTETVVNDVLCLQLTASCESNLSIGTFQGYENITVKCYGKQNNVTLGGSAFGTNSTTTGNLTNTAAILVDILKTNLGISESDIDTASFTALKNLNIESGFAIPYSTNSDFPKYKQILSDLLLSLLSVFWIDTNGKYKIEQRAPYTSATYDTDDNEILKDSFSVGFDYDDLRSDIIVMYNLKEDRETGNKKTFTSETAKFLHSENSQETFKTNLILDTQALELAERISYILGDRKSTTEISVKNRFFLSEINDTIEIERTKIPGTDFNGVTTGTKSYRIVEIDKGLNKINITLDDNKGISDNTSTW